MGEIAHHIIGHGRQDGRRNPLGGDIGQQNGGAIRSTFGNRITTNHAAGSGAVFDHYRCAKAVLHLPRHQPGQQIRRAARREGDNEAHGPRGLRARRQRRGGKNGGQDGAALGGFHVVIPREFRHSIDQKAPPCLHGGRRMPCHLPMRGRACLGC